MELINATVRRKLDDKVFLYSFGEENPETNMLTLEQHDLNCMVNLYTDFLKNVIFIYFLERGEGREKERERNINVGLPLTCSQLGTRPATQTFAQTGN